MVQFVFMTKPVFNLEILSLSAYENISLNCVYALLLQF